MHFDNKLNFVPKHIFITFCIFRSDHNDRQTASQSQKTELIEMLYYMRKELDKVQEENALLRERLDKFVTDALNIKNDTKETEDASHE